MISFANHRLVALQRWLSGEEAANLATPANRTLAWLQLMLTDHGLLRAVWTNQYEIAPGVWRSNQPSPHRLGHLKAKIGLRSVLNLRGNSRHAFHLYEAEACQALDISLFDLRLLAKEAASRGTLETLIGLFRTMEKPVLFHCKSGSDRTGIAAAIYLLVIENRPVAEAQRELDLWYVHLKNTAAGVQDHLLRMYASAQNQTGVGFEEWLHTTYDPAVVTASFQRWQSGDRSLA